MRNEKYRLIYEAALRTAQLRLKISKGRAETLKMQLRMLHDLIQTFDPTDQRKETWSLRLLRLVVPTSVRSTSVYLSALLDGGLPIGFRSMLSAVLTMLKWEVAYAIVDKNRKEKELAAIEARLAEYERTQEQRPSQPR